MMRVQLIHPPTYYNARTMASNRPSLPLGLAYIAAAVRQAGHEVSVLDAIGLAPTQMRPAGDVLLLGLSPEELAERADPSADVFGISNLFTFSWPLVREVAHAIKKRFPEKILIGGGENLTGMADCSLETAPFDFIVSGEGEETVVELLAALGRGERRFDSIAGLVYREDGRIVRTPQRKPIADVDAIPWPAWDLLDVEAYYRHRLVMGIDAGMTIPLLATRGCPYACTFCTSPMMWCRSWRPRTPRLVVDEIQHYMERYSAVNFPFQDLTAAINREWTVAFCREILDRGLKIAWQMPAGTRCEPIDEEVAGLMRDAGARNIALAPESGSARIRDLIGKKMTEKALMRAIRAFVRQRMRITVLFILGFPDETWADVRESIRLARKLAVAGADDMGMGFFYPVPGTQLFNELAAKGRIQLNEDFFGTTLYGADLMHSEKYNYCEHMSARRLTWGKILLILNFYLISYAIRPWRVLRVLANVARDRENTKLEGYLNNQKRRIARYVRSKLGRAPGR